MNGTLKIGNEDERAHMKILVLNYEYPPLGGGGASVCRDVSEMLALHGYDIDIVTMSYKSLPSYEKKNGVNIHRVRCLRTKKMVCHPWEQLTYCLSAYRFIVKKLSIKEYDAIHCHFIIPTGLLALWLKKRFNINYVVTAQGSDVLGHNNTRFGFLYKIVKPLWIKILKNASAITAPSDYLIEKIHDSYSDAECIKVPNGIHVNQYACGNKHKSIITLARLQKSKGIQDLIEACAEVDLGDWIVNILSTGPYKSELSALVEKYNLQDKVFFRGYVSNEERTKYLSEAGIFFSGSWFEAMPVSVLEAMASGCAIIASDIEPHRQLLPDECVYKTKEELSEKLVKNLDMQPDNHVYTVNIYDWGNIVKEYEKIFSKIVFR